MEEVSPVPTGLGAGRADIRSGCGGEKKNKSTCLSTT